MCIQMSHQPWLLSRWCAGIRPLLPSSYQRMCGYFVGRDRKSAKRGSCRTYESCKNVRVSHRQRVLRLWGALRTGYYSTRSGERDGSLWEAAWNASNAWRWVSAPLAKNLPENSTKNEDSSPEECFVNARVLFLVTLGRSSFIVEAVQEAHLLDVIAAASTSSCQIEFTIFTPPQGLERVLRYMQMQKPYAKEALTDLLKVSFNLMVHYTRATDGNTLAENHAGSNAPILGDLWDDAFQRYEPILWICVDRV